MSSIQGYAERTGWIMFAAIVMFAVGFYRIISGISYLANSNRLNDFSSGILGDNMWLWGLWDLGIAALAIWAAYSLLGGGQYGRVFTYLWGIMVIWNGFLIIGPAPWLALGSITLASLVVWGVATTPVDREMATLDRGMGT